MIRLEGYRPFGFAIDDIELSFILDPKVTRVRAVYRVRRVIAGERTGRGGVLPEDARPDAGRAPCAGVDEASDLILDGVGLTVCRIALNGAELAETAYRREGDQLIIGAPLAEFTLEIDATTCPEANTTCEGLYLSEGRFYTQCESQGFRRIAFFPDRPDVLSRFLVRIEADRKLYPTLLSNGDLIDSGSSASGSSATGRHFTVWRDPFPKPCYLFALVAGRFDTLRDSFITMSGRGVALTIHVDPGEVPRVRYAMDALKRAMAWDEQVFGREYDLAEFHIVAVRDLSMGAMENKGLNIFNSARLLADMETATDAEFEDIERVVAHEYFHNWTGNRVTVRDWFQICLKEGLTAFRDQEFTADQRSRAVRRIKEVRTLRDLQFPEDAGPLAHPVRPAQYEKVDNFYTDTVYRKGAELIRALKAVVGVEAFSRGMQIYFDRCDGRAVTIEEFVTCFEEAGGRALNQFFQWYTQPGTPRLISRGSYDSSTGTYRLTVTQLPPLTPVARTSSPFQIPLRVGFIAEDGAELAARCGDPSFRQSQFDLVLETESKTFVFADVQSRPIPAVLRGFSAPVLLDDGLTIRERLVQMVHDPDPFTRWEAGQSLMKEAILAEASSTATPEDAPSLDDLAGALTREIDRAQADPALAALTLDVPELGVLMQSESGFDLDKLIAGYRALRGRIARALEPRLDSLLQPDTNHENAAEQEQAGRRALKNAALALLASLGSERVSSIWQAFEHARNMTERIGALSALSEIDDGHFDEALAIFLDRWQNRPLVMDKWFRVQASAPRNDAVARARRLVGHELFSFRNPNRARAVYAAFGANVPAFHAADGSGYEFLADGIRAIDALNPITAARLVRPFETWRRVDPRRQSKAQAALEGLLKGALSKNTEDMVKRTLA